MSLNEANPAIEKISEQSTNHSLDNGVKVGALEENWYSEAVHGGYSTVHQFDADVINIV
jgi:hypothetical protein